MIRFFFLMLAVISTHAQGAVSSLILSESHAKLVAGTHMQWWLDENSMGTIGSLMKSPVHWQDSAAAIPNLGYKRFPVWFRFNIKNQSENPKWNLVIDYPLIRDFDVFLVRNSQVQEIFQLGERFEFSARPVEHRNYIIPLVVATDTEIEVYLRVNGPYAVQMPVTIMDATTLLENEVYSVLLHGLFFGFVLVMGFYNFFLFLSTREIPYLFYVTFTFFIGLFQFVQQGFAYQFLWPTEVWWQGRMTGVLLHLCLISSYLFGNSFLDMRHTMAWNFKAYGVLVALSVVTLLASPFMDEFWTIRFGVMLVIPATILAVVGGWITWLKGRQDAKYFSIAWFAFLVGGLLLALNKLGLIPRNTFTEHGAEVGTVIELALLAFALAGRIKSERYQRQKLENHAREMERAAFVAKEHERKNR